MPLQIQTVSKIRLNAQLTKTSKGTQQLQKIKIKSKYTKLRVCYTCKQ